NLGRSAGHRLSEGDGGSGGGSGSGSVVANVPRQPMTPHSPSKPFVLVLVGLPGSGKSTFSIKLENAMPWKYTRVNQDKLGNRKACEQLTRDVLSMGKVAVIDRSNFDAQQRQNWSGIAKEAGVPCDCVVFSFQKDVCVRRCEQRRNHETVKAHMAREVVNRMASQFRPPVPLEKKGIFNNGKHHYIVKCKGGEEYRSVQYVSSITEVDELVMRFTTG
ncbi:hypothetical protein ACHAXS_008517, partial [Conticribra weissflogii]